MAIYTPPLRDIQFVMHELLHAVPLLQEIPAYADLDADTVNAVLEEGGKFAAEVLLPINYSGDREGCTLDPSNHAVTTPKGFKEAYSKFVEGGWGALSGDPAFGGQGLPHLVNQCFFEMLNSANQAWTMYPGLSHGAYACLHVHGTPAQKSMYLPKLSSGVWSGTMCLTEAHCGTDLGMLRTKAEPQADGSYKITGAKIFISSGEHDLAENIIHLVLARLPDAPVGSKGISLFVVPKFNVNADGALGERNGIACGALEEKMGIHGNSTCQMHLDGANGTLVGEPNRGLPAMFVMMNAARLGVGNQSLGLTEVAYQNAVAYAKDRLQMRSLTGPKAAEKPADPIIVHPDVRKMLLTARAYAEGARALSMHTVLLLDRELHHPDAEVRQACADEVALLTPIIKAFFTDMGFEATNAAMQCFGGHGYIRDHGMEQFVRDARINQVYEGANGVQALDLVGRKLTANGGKNIGAMFRHIGEVIAASENDPALAPLAASLKRGFGRLQEGTAWLAENGLKNPDNAGAASAEFLRMFGIVLVGMKWLEMAKVANGKKTGDAINPSSFYESKLVLARFWMERVMPDTAALLERMRAGAENIMMLEAANF